MNLTPDVAREILSPCNEICIVSRGGNFFT